MLGRMLTVTAALGLAPCGNAAEIAGTGFDAGNWSGAAYTSDETGAFSHCATAVDFVTGDTLRFVVNADETVRVSMSSSKFAFTPGQRVPVALIVDVRRPRTAIATAEAADTLAVTLPDIGAAMNAFTQGRSLRVEGKDTLGHFDLAGAFRALSATRRCALRQRELEAAGVAPEAAATTDGELPPAGSDAAITPDRAVLVRVAEAMIAETGAKQARILDAADAPAVAADAALFWDDPISGISGSVAVESFARGGLRESDRDDLALVSARCDGRLATDARALPLDGFDAREIRSVCVTDRGRVDTVLAKLLVGDTVLRTMLTFAERAEIAPAMSRRSLGIAVARRVAEVVRAP